MGASVAEGRGAASQLYPNQWDHNHSRPLYDECKRMQVYDRVTA